MPCRSPAASPRKRISPRLAYIRMLRAISEMAAAMTVWSPISNPQSAASSRPFCRALTMSTSDLIGTVDSSATIHPLLAEAVEEDVAFFKVEGGVNTLHGEKQFHYSDAYSCQVYDVI